MNEYRFLGAGDNVGLDLFLSPEPNEYVSYVKPYYGIQIAIHAQEDYPDMKNAVIVQPGYDVKIFITPSILISDEAVCGPSDSINTYYRFFKIKSFKFQVRHLTLNHRKCLFEDEVRFFTLKNRFIKYWIIAHFLSEKNENAR